MRKRLTFQLFVLLAAIAAVPAGAATCPEHFAQGRAPEIINRKLAADTNALCFEAFAVLHSGVTRTPLYSAEHLTRANLDAARTLSRENSFHAESRLPSDRRADLRDYARSGFDRGHLSPNGDMPTRNAQFESFSLANIVPQNPNNNRHLWEGIESATRKLAEEEGELYVITGPAYLGSEIQKVGNVLVPTHLFKLIYSPKQHRTAAYFVANEATKDYVILSAAKLEQAVGMNLLPALPARVKEATIDLPKPISHYDGKGRNGKRKKGSEGNEEFVHNRGILATIEHWLKKLK